MITMNEMLATIHIQPDMYDLEHGREYRIGKEYNVSGEKKAKHCLLQFHDRLK